MMWIRCSMKKENTMKKDFRVFWYFHIIQERTAHERHSDKTQFKSYLK